MSILTRIREIKEVPTLPEVMVKVQALINSDKSDAASLALIIKRDPSLTSTILKTANSSYYNISKRRISSISEAIARIGFNEVMRITMAMSMIEQFPNTRNIINYREFWRHSLTASGLTAIIADRVNDPSLKELNQDIFLAGLLHDIGVLVYDQFFHKEFSAIIDYSVQENVTYLEAEKIVAPKETHAFLGSALLEIWKLPTPVIAAVRFHHAPGKAPEHFRKLVAIVALAEYILCNGRVGSLEGAFEDSDENIWLAIGFTLSNINSIFESAEVEAEKIDILLSGIPHGTTNTRTVSHQIDQTPLRLI